MLRTHYRQPIDWTARVLEKSEETLRLLDGTPAWRLARRGDGAAKLSRPWQTT